MLNKPVYIWSRTSRLSTPLTLGRRGQRNLCEDPESSPWFDRWCCLPELARSVILQILPTTSREWSWFFSQKEENYRIDPDIGPDLTADHAVATGTRVK